MHIITMSVASQIDLWNYFSKISIFKSQKHQKAQLFLVIAHLKNSMTTKTISFTFWFLLCHHIKYIASSLMVKKWMQSNEWWWKIRRPLPGRCIEHFRFSKHQFCGPGARAPAPPARLLCVVRPSATFSCLLKVLVLLSLSSSSVF